jgi:adenine-specific DNA methylase
MSGNTTLRRQGDLLFRPIDTIPTYTALPVDGNVVALGEVTGHKHQCKGGLVQLYADPLNQVDGQIDFIEVKEETTLSHEEHNAILLPKGKYAVVHEREYNPFAAEADRIRQVVD